MKKIWLFGFALFSMFIFAGCGNSPEDVAKNFVKAAEKSDVETMKSLSTFVKNDTDAAFATKMFKSAGVKRFLVGEEKAVKGENGEATVGCRVTGYTKNAKKIVFELKRIPDWKITNITMPKSPFSK